MANIQRWIHSHGGHQDTLRLRQRADLAEQLTALSIAARATKSKNHVDEINAEMKIRVAVAMAMVDEGDDYTDWMEFTQELRAG